MTKTIQTMAASLAHAAWTKTVAKIGGGTYDATECSEAARALKAFPAMLAALQDCVTTEGANCWQSPAATVRRVRAINEIAQAAIAAATGSPTGGAEPATPTDGTEGKAQTYTAFCQQSDGCGTIWIDTVEVPAGTENPIRDARERAIAACSFDWNYDPASVHCLGLVLGDATVCYWDDLADA